VAARGWRGLDLLGRLLLLLLLLEHLRLHLLIVCLLVRLILLLLLLLLLSILVVVGVLLSRNRTSARRPLAERVLARSISADAQVLKGYVGRIVLLGSCEASRVLSQPRFLLIKVHIGRGTHLVRHHLARVVAHGHSTYHPLLIIRLLEVEVVCLRINLARISRYYHRVHLRALVLGHTWVPLRLLAHMHVLRVLVQLAHGVLGGYLSILVENERR
jgi:hypothetical protein